MHLELSRGLHRAAQRAREIDARTVQVFVDNPTAWKRRTAPPKHLDEFRQRLQSSDIRPVAVHASYLVNLAGAARGFREQSIAVLASDMLAATAYGATLVNVHTGSHRETSIDDGIERVAHGVAEVLRRVDEARELAADADRESPVPMLVLENAAGGGSAVGATIEELARIAARAAELGVPDARLGFCIDVAHAWGAGVAMDDPDAIDAFLAAFDAAIGLRRLVLIHLNDSKTERGSRTDRHVHVGAGQIGPRGIGHLLRHPALRNVPFILETPGMDVGYDRINVERARALFRGETLPTLPPEAFRLPRRSAASAPAPDDVDRRASVATRSRPPAAAPTRAARTRSRAARPSS